MYINVSSITNQIHEHSYNRCTCTTTIRPEEEVEVEAFFYIVVVIAFYSITIVILLIKYNRNDDEEQSSKYNYSEYVNRERFQTAQYKNRIAVERTKAVLGSLNLLDNMKVAAGSVCPVIIVSEYPDDDVKNDVYDDTVCCVDETNTTTSQTSYEDCDDIISISDFKWTSVYFDALIELKDCECEKLNSTRRRSCESI